METLPMKKIFQVAVIVLVVAFCFGQMALAEEAPSHAHARLVAHGNSVHSDTAAPKNLYIGWAAFTTAGDNFGGPNTDGTPLWPCFGNYDGTNTTSEDAD